MENILYAALIIWCIIFIIYMCIGIYNSILDIKVIKKKDELNHMAYEEYVKTLRKCEKNLENIYSNKES